MKATVRQLLAVTATTALAASLAACGPNASQQDNASAPAGAAPAPQAGWSMNDLAQVDPSYVSGHAALPQAVPMQASYSGRYRQAPSVDYSGGGSVSYERNATPDDYQYLGMASGLTGMLGDAPPDYAFDYGGVRPWGWQTADHYTRYAEPVSGGYRYYYYQPDSARPFLISDPYYSYGYRGDQLVTIYDRSGRLVDARNAARERQAALNYYARAAEMYQAAHRERRLAVAASLWQQHRDEVAREQRQLDEARRERQAWQQWDARNDPRLQRDWASEALVRRQAEVTFANWQKTDFRTPPPRLYTDQQRQAQLQQVAALRRQQQAQRVELANRAADQRATRLQQQAQAQKLAKQRETLALQQQHQQLVASSQRAEQAKLQEQQQHQLAAARDQRMTQAKLQEQQQHQLAQTRDQRMAQAKLQAQRQQQLAQAQRQQLAQVNAIAKQKASAAQAKQIAEQKAQLARADAQKAEQAKAAAARHAAAAAADKHKGELAQLAAEQKAKQAAAAKLAAERKAQQASAAKKTGQERAAQAHAAQLAHKQKQADKTAAADRSPKRGKDKHDNGRG